MLMNRNWKLVDRQDFKEKDAAVVDNYSESVTKKIEKGSKVKLIFNTFETDSGVQQTELLWVEILLVQGEKYLGQLEEDPKQINDLEKGEMIEFETRHIVESEYIDPFDSTIKI